MFVKQDVIQLRIIVRHPQRQRTAAQHPAERAEFLFAGENKCKLRPDRSDAPASVGLHRRAQLVEPVFGVVEVRNRFMERCSGEVGQRLLELAEGDRRLIKIVAVARRFKTEAAGDKIIGSPELPLRIDGVFSAVFRRAEADHLQSNVLARNKARNSINILDQLFWMPKCNAVDALERINSPAAAGNTEGAVNMTISKRFAGDGRSVQTKLL